MPPSLTLTLYKAIGIHFKYKGKYISLQGNVVIVLVVRPFKFHGFLKKLRQALGPLREADTYHTLGGDLPGNVAPGFDRSALRGGAVGEDNKNKAGWPFFPEAILANFFIQFHQRIVQGLVILCKTESTLS
jgi:hypothetical protein